MSDELLYAYERCNHEGIGKPGCPTCDPDRHRVAARAAFVARRGLYTRAEVLAFGERVKAHYQEALRVAHIDMQPVDVARLLEET